MRSENATDRNDTFYVLEYRSRCTTTSSGQVCDGVPLLGADCRAVVACSSP